MAVQTDPTTGERLINVPGRGQMRESEFRSAVQNGSIAAGPSGSAMNDALNSGTYTDPYAGGNQQSQPAAAPKTQGNTGTNGAGATGGSAANQAASTMQANDTTSTFGSGMGGGDARNENVYGLRNNDDPTSWARRVFAQGTADFGNKSLNPYLDQNPMANSPFAQWYQSRYGTAAPTNALVASEISGQAPTAGAMQGAMQTAQQGGGPGAPTMAGAQSNLQQLNQMVNNKAAGTGNLNTSQGLFAGQLMNDPQLASQIITSQLQGGTGGWGMGFLGNSLSNLATHYYNDPGNQGPQSPNGTFLNQAMKMMGMA